MRDNIDVLQKILTVLWLFMFALLFYITVRYAIPQEKAEQRNKYEAVTYQDGAHTYKIIKDKLGDVIYCEPIE